MDIKGLSFENGSIYIKRKISKEDYKSIFLNIKTKYKKYSTNFFEKYINDTAFILTTTSFATLMYGAIHDKNHHILFDFVTTLDNENVYLKMAIKYFYNYNISEFSKEQLEFLVNNKLEDLEKDVLFGVFSKLKTNEDFAEELKNMLEKMINLDIIVYEYKEKMKNGEEITSAEIDSKCLLNLFGEFAISVKRDLLKGDENFIEA